MRRDGGLVHFGGVGGRGNLLHPDMSLSGIKVAERDGDWADNAIATMCEFLKLCKGRVSFLAVLN